MKLLKQIGERLNDYSLKKKFYILYILCVLLPLVLTDTVVTYSVLHTEAVARKHAMENTANAVQYSLLNSIENASEIAKSIYMNHYINDFLNDTYDDPLDYYNSYLDFFKDTLLESIAGIDNIIVTMYSDNETIVNGSEFNRLETITDSTWYHYLQESGLEKVLFFDYDQSRTPAIEAKRKIYFIQKLDYFRDIDPEKVVRVELDYSSMSRNLAKMNYDTAVYICSDDVILLSNGKYSSVAKDFEKFTEQEKVGYSQDINLYGIELTIYVLRPETEFISELSDNLPVLLLLVIINTVLPLLLVRGFNKSFTVRIGELSEAFRDVSSENLVEITTVRGKDEIGSLMQNYNRMAARINALIQIVYKNRIREQEMTVARQNAELLALHSQINPHFLFNTLESIRMHSILKHEIETADMVEKLSVMQRQYVEWGNDLIDVSKETDFVRAYLSLQKYRFGDRLSYEIQLEEGLEDFRIPKLSIVTFVENACIHGVEKKITPGWIFVHIYQEGDFLCIEIEDTGKGMKETEMAELQLKMENACIEMLQEKGRVGIINACLRLKMISDHEVKFEIDGEEGIGTMVQIKIPVHFVCKKEEKHAESITGR